MSGLGSEPSRDEVLDALDRIRRSILLRTKNKPVEVLTFIVTRRLDVGAGVKIDQKDIAAEVWGNPKFDSSSTLVRAPVTQLRDLLPKYYATEGRNDPVWIELPEKGYVPLFTRHTLATPPEPESPPSSNVPPEPPRIEPPHPADPRPPIWKRKPVVAGAIFTLGALFVVYWSIHDRHCGEGMRIAMPADGSSVMTDELIQGTRTPREPLCRCKDYLVVEPLGLRDFYIQEKLLDGPEWSAAARFGDPSTPSGTRFDVFVLSTTQNLPRGPISPSSKLIEGAKRSRSVQVTLKRLAAWIRLGNTAGLVASRTPEAETTRDEFHGVVSGTAASAEASVFVLYRLIKECFHSKNPPSAGAKGATIPTCDPKYPDQDSWMTVEANLDASGNWSASIDPEIRESPEGEVPWLVFWQVQAIAVPDREDLVAKMPPWRGISQEQLKQIMQPTRLWGGEPHRTNASVDEGFLNQSELLKRIQGRDPKAAEKLAWFFAAYDAWYELSSRMAEDDAVRKSRGNERQAHCLCIWQGAEHP